LFADNLRTEPAGGSLQRCHIVHSEESSEVARVCLSADKVTLGLRHRAKPTGGVNGKKRCHADWPEHLVPDIKITGSF
jgi:hypothetical protein